MQNQQIQTLTTDPNNLQNIYAGSVQSGVFASTDAGVTWQDRSSGLPASVDIHALAFDLAGKKLYAATSAGLFVSSDSATSWSQVAHTPTDDYSALTFDVNNPRVIYTSTAHSGILLSRDDGVTWTNIGGNLPSGTPTSVLYDANQNNVWVAFAAGLYRSSDNGATWHAMGAGLPANVGINTLALGSVLSGSSDLIFAGTHHGFFLSSDAGQHWEQSQLSLAALNVSAVLLDASQPNVVYASTDIGVLRSNDNGQNWNQVASGLPNNQPFAGLTQGGVNYTQLLVASRGVYRFPGNGSVLDPGRFIPILLVLLFFFLLYFFFVRRRRRPARQASPDASAPSEPDSSASNNGRFPAGSSGADVPQDQDKLQES